VDKLKENLVWIVVGVIVLGALGFYTVSVIPVWEEAAQKRGELSGKYTDLTKKAQKAGSDDTLKTPAHVELAKEYRTALATQGEALKKSLTEKTFNTKFTDAPSNDLAFDTWLGEKRTKLIEQASAAGLTILQDKTNKEVVEMLLLEPTNENASDVKLRRAYRLRHLAIFEEVVAALTKKHAKVDVAKFEPNVQNAEPVERLEVGATVLEKFHVLLEKDWADRAKAVHTEVLRRAELKGAAPAGSNLTSDLPYTLTGVELIFQAPLQAVPKIAQEIENTHRYTAILTRIDTQRTTTPFPPANDQRLAKAGPVDGLNTHFREAPVRALLAFDILEFDKAKEAKAAEAAAEAAKGPAKSGKSGKTGK
jgi:hypothetical protein